MTIEPKQRHHDIRLRAVPQTVPIVQKVSNRIAIPVRRVIDFRPYSMRQREVVQPTGVKQKISRMIGTLVLLFALVSVGSYGQTISFYNDIEQSADNVFTAGLVDFVLTDTPFASVASTTDWEVDVLPHELSNPFYYYASSTDFVGDDGLCNALTVTATLDGVTMYSGPLTELVTGTTTVIETWTFDFDNFESYSGQSCKFFVEYNSWQTRHGMNQGGYSDTERVMYTITVPSLLLGKVYFTDSCNNTATTTVTASGTTSCNDTQTWVELYNRTNVAIDTAGWSLCASNSCFTIADSQYIDSTVIPAGEYGIVAADPRIHTQISLPLGVAPLITDGVWFASDLDPVDDMLQLVDPNGLSIDQLNWGVATTSWTNYNADLWPDNSLTATSGYALARLPVGFDSNVPEDWVLLGVPTLTIDDISPQIFEEGATTTITYTAVNTNGLSEDLRIDLYLFEVDDTLHVIELDVENTGSYSFVFPEGLDGPIRIKPVATSPENLLLNARAISAPLPIATTSSTSGFSASIGNSAASSLFASVSTTTTDVVLATSTAATSTATTTQEEGELGSTTTTTTTTATTTSVSIVEMVATTTSSSSVTQIVEDDVVTETVAAASTTAEMSDTDTEEEVIPDETVIEEMIEPEVGVASST